MKTRTETLDKAVEQGHNPTKYDKMINNLIKYMPCIPQGQAIYIACGIMFAHAINFSKTSISGYDTTSIHEVIEMLLNNVDCTYLIQGLKYCNIGFKKELIVIDYHYNGNVTRFEFERKRNIYTNNVFNSKLLSIKTY